jgi:hypothetical protein
VKSEARRHADGATLGPSEYRRAIRLPTRETSLNPTCCAQSVAKPCASGEMGLEIRMQSVEITWAPKADC